MVIAQYVLIACLSLVLAGGLIWVTDRISRKPAQQSEIWLSEPTSVLLYQSGVLLDANSAGRALLRAKGDSKGDWSFVSEYLSKRFPGFPSFQVNVESDESKTFSASDPDDGSFVVLEQWDDMARITLQHIGVQETPSSAETTRINPVLDDAPYPIWQSDESGQVTWANSAYLDLATRMDLAIEESVLPRVFETDPAPNLPKPTRTAVTNSDRTQSYWFDVSSIKRTGQYTHYATDANAIVNAEIAQRNFVQTLTKTFAQLSIGLAIFDRNRQLALFNPALIDLTALPADFLSSRPNLMTFFDRMRENRMMPEPRNYASWREHLAEVVVAASDDRYTETWSLPSGVTYRVVGRPHPDGATAFLFEDISAEVSLARRFRADLELGLSALDTVHEGVAVFSPSGKLGFCNAVFRDLWDIEPELSITEYTLQEALHHWRTHSEKSDLWERLRHHVLDLNPRENWERDLLLVSGKRITVRVVSLNGGFTSILFAESEVKKDSQDTLEMMAG